jgi:hypothetical protein
MPEPQRGRAYEFSLILYATATGQPFASPPLAAGDVTVSKDHGAFAPLATLPTVAPAGSAVVRVQLTATEMTANQVDLAFHDPDGVWEDVHVQIQPTLTLGSDAKVLLSSDPQPAMTLAVGAITAAQLALDACQKIADILARRHTSAIEASPHGETLVVNSLYGALAMTTGHKRDTTTHADALTVFQSNGTTELAQVPLQTDALAAPIVEVGD